MVVLMAFHTHLRCQRERQFRWFERERQSVLERQRLEWRVPASSGHSETCHFSSIVLVEVFCIFSRRPFLQP